MNTQPTTPDLYLHHGGQDLGPYSPAAAREMVALGSVPPDVLPWREGLYGLAVQARVLGVLYHSHRDRLGWF